MIQNGLKFNLTKIKAVRVYMYEFSSTPRETEELEDGTLDENFDPKLAEAIDRFRRYLLIGVVNQHLGHLPSSLNNDWLGFLRDLRMFIPKNCDYEYLMVKSSKELNILVNGHDFIGYIGNRIQNSPIDDPKLLDYLADFFGGLDGIFGLILATNEYVGQELRSELLTSEYSLRFPNTSTRKLLESHD
jgi:hypothetical protein